MTDSNCLVSCQGVSKKFCRNLKRSLWYGVKDGFSEITKGYSSKILRKEEFWALKDIEFELKRGECLGLLGRNGAGKTTLLKILSGLIKPDEGTVILNGRVGGLIALGAGFNGILTGRENIRINGSILGYSRCEVEQKMQDIIDFSEIHDFIDAPVNSYSSGMTIRLGFAIAAVLTKPDILLLDEVLAVGDIGFVIKCLNAVNEMMKNTAVIFVSHNMQFISQFCSKVLVLEKGNKLGIYKTKDGVQKYLNNFPLSDIQVLSDEFILSDINLVDNERNIFQKVKNKFQINNSENVNLEFIFDVDKKTLVKFEIEIVDSLKQPIISYIIDENLYAEGKSLITIPLSNIYLNSGNYSIVICVEEVLSKVILTRLENICSFYFTSKELRWGKFILSTNFVKKLI